MDEFRKIDMLFYILNFNKIKVTYLFLSLNVERIIKLMVIKETL